MSNNIYPQYSAQETNMITICVCGNWTSPMFLTSAFMRAHDTNNGDFSYRRWPLEDANWIQKHLLSCLQRTFLFSSLLFSSIYQLSTSRSQLLTSITWSRCDWPRSSMEATASESNKLGGRSVGCMILIMCVDLETSLPAAFIIITYVKYELKLVLHACPESALPSVLSVACTQA